MASRSSPPYVRRLRGRWGGSCTPRSTAGRESVQLVCVVFCSSSLGYSVDTAVAFGRGRDAAAPPTCSFMGAMVCYLAGLLACRVYFGTLGGTRRPSSNYRWGSFCVRRWLVLIVFVLPNQRRAESTQAGEERMRSASSSVVMSGRSSGSDSPPPNKPGVRGRDVMPVLCCVCSRTGRDVLSHGGASAETRCCLESFVCVLKEIALSWVLPSCVGIFVVVCLSLSAWLD